MNRILIVIVLYQQSLEKSAAYLSLKSSVGNVGAKHAFFVYDNSPVQQFTLEEVHYVHDAGNSGVSCAYNQAAQYAREKGFVWMLLSDQDTNYPNDMLKKYMDVIQNHPDIKLIVPKVRTHKGFLLSPCRYTHKRGKYLQSIESGKLLMNRLSVINSGMMVRVDTFISVGGYNEKVPLDLSDHQFIERYKRQERFFLILDAEILQDFSNEETNADKLYNRFRTFADAIRSCERTNIIDSVDYFLLILRRTMMLTLRTKQIRFIKYFIAAYLCNYKR
ncbi:MAG: glycosyltransferase [Bacteroidales bacterium]|jgi:GT2 family glycosyltransferase|nr:glycosyltransferase [Bacteroidales bacterium]